MRKVRVAVATLDQLAPDTGKVVALGTDGGECAIFLHAGRCHAVGSLCPHQNASLDGAPIIDGVITCRRHGYRFELKSGDCITLGGYALPVFETSVENEIVYVSYWEYE